MNRRIPNGTYGGVRGARLRASSTRLSWSHYGEDIIGEYSQKLMIEVGKKYNPRTLRRMRQLYLLFENQKWSPVATKCVPCMVNN